MRDWKLGRSHGDKRPMLAYEGEERSLLLSLCLLIASLSLSSFSLLRFLFLLKWWPTLEDQSKWSNNKKEVRAVFLADSPQPAPCVYFLNRERVM